MPYDSINDAVTMQGGAGPTLGRIDQYELLRELGGGGFGTVYLAKNEVSGINVAVKGLPPFVKNNKEELGNIRRNFALVSRLHHPNIAAALDLHPAKEVAYASEDVRQKLRVMPGDTLMVMEYAPGTTLSQWRMQFEDGKVPPEKAAEIVGQVAAALDYAHERKIVHRDVKPANIMVETAEDGSLKVRVLDFGLAAEIRTSLGRLSREIRDTSGTRPYMAPEQWLGGRQGPATDQYSLAAMYHELVVGEVPFASVFQTGDPAVMMNVVGREKFTPLRDFPRTVRKALSRALAKKPEERFRSCADFGAAIAGKAPRRCGFGRLLAAAALLAALAGGVWWMKEGRKGTEETKATKGTPAIETVTNQLVQPTPQPPSPEKESEPFVTPVPGIEPKPQIETKIVAEQEPPAPAPKPEPPPPPSKPAVKPTPEPTPAPKPERPPPLSKPAVKPAPEPTPAPKADAVKPTPTPKPVVKPQEKSKLSVAELAALDVSGLKAGAMRSVDIGGGVSLDLVWCPPGEFTMGSSVGEYGRGHNEDQTHVSIPNGFWLGKYEVTQAQWKRVKGDVSSKFIGVDPAAQPVDSVNLEECQAFAAELNRQQGTNGFRLPSSAEWEYACRAGTTTPYAVKADGFNCAETRQKRPTKVGAYPPNAWGICDMHGNLAEWTPDLARGKMFQQNGVSVRGGCWKFKSFHCRSAAVHRENPRKKSPCYGFRICFDPKG